MKIFPFIAPVVLSLIPLNAIANNQEKILSVLERVKFKCEKVTRFENVKGLNFFIDCINGRTVAKYQTHRMYEDVWVVNRLSPYRRDIASVEKRRTDTYPAIYEKIMREEQLRKDFYMQVITKEGFRCDRISGYAQRSGSFGTVPGAAVYCMNDTEVEYRLILHKDKTWSAQLN